MKKSLSFNTLFLFIILIIFVVSCEKNDDTSVDSTAPTAYMQGQDTILIGDTITMTIQMTGTPPFELVYSDGEDNHSIDILTGNSLIIKKTPKITTLYSLISIKDKNKTGTVSGNFNAYVQPHFLSKAPSYSNINSTVGNIQNNLFFSGHYLNIDELNSSFIFTQKDKNQVDCIYSMSDHTYVTFDYNNDGYLDLFGWCYNITPVMGRNPGIYVLINNYLSPQRKITFYDSDISWPSGLELNDFNNDGIEDVLFYSYNNHSDGGGESLNLAKPVKIFLFSKDGAFLEVDATAPYIIHDMASGDVDNDGDVDLLVWEYDDPSLPYLYLNDGNGNFTETDSYNTFKGLSVVLDAEGGFNPSFPATAVELFDIDNDGYLDITLGHGIGFPERIHFYDPYTFPGCRVYWGNPNGTFDFVNGYSDMLNTSITDFSLSNVVLGFNYIDFNQDGKMDILTVVTPNYGGYILQLHENLGNRTFIDVTETYINSFNGKTSGPLNPYGHPTGYDGDFPNFYEIRPYDIDNDGDFDLVPHGVACWEPYKYPKNLYWENIGGSFILKK